MATIPLDPLFSTQIHLRNTAIGTVDMNVVDAWDDYTGDGVQITIFDDGFDLDHPDLDANFITSLGYDYQAIDSDPTWAAFDDTHGTSVAGIIGAEEGNGIGGVGVAWDADLVGYRRFAIGNGINDGEQIRDAAGLGDGLPVTDPGNTGPGNVNGDDNGTDIINVSGGRGSSVFSTGASYDDVVAALAEITQYGRGGLGTIYVKSSGNSRAAANSVNREEGTAEPLDSSEYSINAAAIRADGWINTSSTPGANVLISAVVDDTSDAGAIVTTDLVGADGDPGDYTTDFSGTSSAAPQISGVVALMLEANPNLGWRDVQEILAYSARQVGSAVDGPANAGAPTGFANEQATRDGKSWFWNDAQNWNGGALHFSNDYGFGLVDATAAVRLAETWDVQSTTANQVTHTLDGNFSTLTLDTATLGFDRELPEDMIVEYVTVNVDFDVDDLADMNIYLRSPDGTEVQLINDTGDTEAFDTGSGGWDFGTHAFRGTVIEGASDPANNGDWAIRFKNDDGAANGAFTVDDYKITFTGRRLDEDKTYIFTNEYSDYASGSEHTTSFNGGYGSSSFGRFNAAAVTSNTTVNLLTNSGTIDGVSITATNISHVYTGDGNDTVTGDSVSEFISTGRGNDSVDGGDRPGGETINGGEGNDTINGGDEDDTLIDGINGTSQGTDTLNGGGGDDLIVVNWVSGGTYDGGADNDTLDTSEDDTSVNVDLSGTSFSSFGATFTGFENAITGAGFNNVTGSNSANLLVAGRGADDIDGLGGDDTIFGDDQPFGLLNLNDVSITNQRLEATTFDEMPTDAFTVEWLFQSDAAVPSGGTSFVSYATASSTNEFLVFGNAGSGGKVAIYVNGTAVLTDYNTADLYDGDTHRVSVSVNTGAGPAGRVSLYVDGVEEYRGPGGSTNVAQPITSGGTFILGQEQDSLGGNFDSNQIVTGGMGDVRVWSVERDQADIDADKFAQFDNLDLPANPALVANWQLDLDTETFDNLAGSQALTKQSGGSQFTTQRFSPDGGNDTILGGTGADFIDGGSGNDSITAGTDDLSDGMDTVYGGAGNDTIRGGYYEDLLFGEAGDDTFIVTLDERIDTIDGGSGTDLLDMTGVTSAAGVARMTVNLETGAFSQEYSSGSIYAGALTGIEDVNGSSVEDSITGSAGANELNGGAGDDTINGGGGADIIEGGTGDDRLLLTGSVDDVLSLDGGGDNDTLDLSGFGGTSFEYNLFAQSIFGGLGTSLFSIENIIGTDQADYLVGTIGANTLLGGEGDDTIDGHGGADLLDGGGGENTLTYISSNAGVLVNLGANTAQNFPSSVTSHAQDDTISNFDHIEGSDFRDRLTGDAGNNSIQARDGDDIIEDSAGVDTLRGGIGNDTLQITNGSNAVGEIYDGGDDTDNLYLFGTGAGSVFDFTDDTVENMEVLRFLATVNPFTGGGTAQFTSTQAQQFNEFGRSFGTAAAVVDITMDSSVLDLSGATITDFVSGRDLFEIGGATGPVTITGSQADDSIQGSTGADSLSGAGGNDTIDGGAGNDTVNGGDGDDLLLLTGGAADLDDFDGGGNNDTLDASGFAGSNYVFDLFFNEISDGTNTADLYGVENIIGTDQADVIVGDTGVNTLSGGMGDDTIEGDGGADDLDGGGGVNTLSYVYSNAGVTVDLGTNTAQNRESSVTSHAQDDTISNFDHIWGSDYDDRLKGNSGDNSIDGGIGDDIIEDTAGVDTLFGSFDNDTLQITDGSNAVGETYDGGDGTDNLYLFGTGAGSVFNFTDDTVLNMEVLRFLSTVSPFAGGGTAQFTSTQAQQFNVFERSGGTAPALVDIVMDNGTLDLSGSTVTGFVAGQDGFVITGDAIGDSISGSDAEDTITGNGGNDTLSGGGGNDSVSGGSGDDQIIWFAGDGEDTLDGGANSDILKVDGDATGEALNLTAGATIGDFTVSRTNQMPFDLDARNFEELRLEAGDGNDTITSGNGMGALVGTIRLSGGSGDDVILGGDANETIMGNNDNDTITGGGGNDLVFGNSGDDLAIWNEGDGSADNFLMGDDTDTVEINADPIADDVITIIASSPFWDSTVIRTGPSAFSFGLESVEILEVNAGGGNDDISGETGLAALGTALNLSGEAGEDTLTGGDGNDTLDGGEGRDTLNGEAGDDVLLGGTENDRLSGGADNDTLSGGVGDDTLLGDGGFDTVDYSARANGVHVNLNANSGLAGGTYAGGVYTGATETDLLFGMENIIGTAHGDLLEGKAGAAAVIDSGAGNDRVITGSRNDHVTLGEGNDTAITGAGTDVIVEGEGIDVINGGPGFDTLDMSGVTGDAYADLNTNTAQTGGISQAGLVYSGATETNNVSGIENVIGTGFNDILIGKSGSAAVIDGGGGDDQIVGGIRNDFVTGGAGDDTITTGAGSDRVFLGAGSADEVDAGSGLDTANYSASTTGVYVDLTNEFGRTGGFAVGGVYTNEVESDTLIGFEFAVGSAYNDVLIANAPEYARISGGGGNDYIIGGNRRDRLNGEGDDDTIQAGGGNDDLNGGLGADVLTGDLGRDVFIFDNTDAVDTITDFEDGLDQIDLTFFGTGAVVAFTDNGGDAEMRVDGTLVAVLENEAVVNLTAADYFLV